MTMATTMKIITYNVIMGDYFGPGDGRSYMESDEVIAKVKELAQTVAVVGRTSEGQRH